MHEYFIYFISITPSPSFHSFSVHSTPLKKDHVGLDNMSGALSLEQINSPPLSSYWLSVALYLYVGPLEIFIIYFDVAVCVALIQVSLSQSYCQDLMSMVSLLYLRHCLATRNEMTTNTDEDIRKKRHPLTTAGSATLCSHYGNLCGGFSEN